MNKFAIRLKELREERALSQEQLAKELGFSRASITNWELGNREPNFNILIKICKYFNVSTDYLLGILD